MGHPARQRLIRNHVYGPLARNEQRLSVELVAKACERFTRLLRRAIWHAGGVDKLHRQNMVDRPQSTYVVRHPRINVVQGVIDGQLRTKAFGARKIRHGQSRLKAIASGRGFAVRIGLDRGNALHLVDHGFQYDPRFHCWIADRNTFDVERFYVDYPLLRGLLPGEK